MLGKIIGIILAVFAVAGGITVFAVQAYLTNREADARKKAKEDAEKIYNEKKLKEALKDKEETEYITLDAGKEEKSKAQEEDLVM